MPSDPSPPIIDQIPFFVYGYSRKRWVREAALLPARLAGCPRPLRWAARLSITQRLGQQTVILEQF